MSHEDFADNQRRRAKRRKVEFQTTLEDLEGRVLLSAVRQLPPRLALMQQQRALLNNRPNPQFQQRLKASPFALAQARAQALRAQLAAQAEAGGQVQQGPRARFAAMNAMRMRRPMINFQPSINVNPTINVNGGAVNPTVNAPIAPPTANPTAPITPPPSQVVPTTPSTPAPSDQTWPANVARPKPNPKPTPTPAPKPAPTPTPKPTTPEETKPTKPEESKPTPTPKPTTPEETKPNKPEESKPTPSPEPTKPEETKPNKPEETKPEESKPTKPTTPAPTFSDGTILRNEQTGELGWYSNGHRQLISPPVASKMGLTEAQTKVVTDKVFKTLPKGNDYFPEGMFVRNEWSGEISRYSGGVFHVVSPPIAERLGLSVDDVATISMAQYAGVNKGPDYFPEGVHLQNQQSGEIAIYQGGQRRWISVAVASKMGLTAGQLTVISPAQFNAIPQGRDYFPDGVYLQNQENGEIALHSGEKLRVVSAPVASKMGLTAADLIAVSPTQYLAINKGPDYFIEGMFIQNNQSGEINQYSEGQRHWVSPSVAAQINLTAAQITTIGADQFNAIPLGADYAPPAPEALAPTPTERT